MAKSNASKSVIVDQLVKQGADVDIAKKLSSAVVRRRSFKRSAPYLVAAVVVTASTYVIFGWGYAVILGLFSLLGLQSLYFSDKRSEYRPNDFLLEDILCVLMKLFFGQ